MSSPLPPQPQPSSPPTSPRSIEPRVVAAGAGAAWWGEGWRIFTSRLGTWIGIAIVYIIVSLALSKVPYIGGLAQWLLTPVFIGGIMLGCNALDRGEPLRFSHLFDGFTGPHFVPLLTIGVFNIVLAVVAVIACCAVIAAGVGMAGLTNLDKLSDDPLRMLGEFGFVAFLLLVLVLIAVAIYLMANWFAPALIVLGEARAADAMRASFRASLRNWVPFLVYGAIGVGLLLAVIAVFAMLVGVIGFGAVMTMVTGNGNWGSMIFGVLLILVAYVAVTVVVAPVTFGSVYAGYRDILAADNSATANAASR